MVKKRSSKRRSDYDIKYKRIFKRKMNELIRKIVERERGLVCKHCGSDNLVKYGLSNAKIVYEYSRTTQPDHSCRLQ